LKVELGAFLVEPNGDYGFRADRLHGHYGAAGLELNRISNFVFHRDSPCEMLKLTTLKATLGKFEYR
jgi:hypothetical protein